MRMSFIRVIALFNQPLDKWNVYNVKNMKRMFMGSGFWRNNSRNTSSVSTYKQTRVVRDLNSWDVSNVEEPSETPSNNHIRSISGNLEGREQ